MTEPKSKFAEERNAEAEKQAKEVRTATVERDKAAEDLSTAKKKLFDAENRLLKALGKPLNPAPQLDIAKLGDVLPVEDPRSVEGIQVGAEVPQMPDGPPPGQGARAPEPGKAPVKGR